ncbi:hypothetical protein ACWGR4_36475 [Embleya sp. NPDC055664]
MMFPFDPESPTPTPTHHEPAAPTGRFGTWATPPDTAATPPRPTEPPSRPEARPEHRPQTHPEDPAPAWPASASAPAPIAAPAPEPAAPFVAHPAPSAPIEEPSGYPQGGHNEPADKLLRIAATHRSIPDLARMITILDDGSGTAADDALREAAMTRPVSDLVLLTDLLRNPTYAAQDGRPATESDPHAPGGTAAFAPESAPRRSAAAGGAGLRWVTAVSLAVSGVALGSAIPATFRTPPYTAAWLAAVALTCLFLAGLTSVRAGRNARLAALAAGCATIATAVVPQLTTGRHAAAWLDTSGLIALGAGSITALCAAAFLARHIDLPHSRQPKQPVAFEPWEATMPENRAPSSTRMLG